MSGTETKNDLTILGQPMRAPQRMLEGFAKPANVTRVTFHSDELTSMCPITGQPDFSSVTIDYEPDQTCIESKSLKLYLWSFRDDGLFCETLADVIANDVMRFVSAKSVKVTIDQGIRGGIATSAVAELPLGDR